MRANLLVFRFLLRRRVSITMQLQQCYGMPLRRRAATATATATASSSCSMSHLQVRHRKFTVPPIEKISLLAMHTRVDDSLVTTATGAWGPRQ